MEPSLPATWSVCGFESRRRDELASLITRAGGVPFVAPSMREVPIEQNTAVFSFGDRLLNPVGSGLDLIVFLTGVGAQSLVELLATRAPEAVWYEALNRVPILVRGPKPAAKLREWGVRIDYRVPEPNTWRELLTVMETEQLIAGKTIAIQEYGAPSDPLYEELQQRGATVLPVPVYRWMLPEDLEPLQTAIRRTVAGDFHLLLFTSAQQARHAVEVAGQLGLAEQWLASARRCVIASIGPTASEALAALDLPPDMEPSHPKMGPLVKESLEQAAAIWPQKQAAG